jgi:hypothetical protein
MINLRDMTGSKGFNLGNLKWGKDDEEDED